jgi:ribosome-associated heat shock protein Hsp15
MSAVETARVDRWLWAVRLYKPRSAATDACRGGHVKVNGRTAKPATPVRPGDRVEAFAGGRTRVLEVVEAIETRVGAAVAAACVVDHSAPPPPRPQAPADPFARDRGTGRPTKRDRREMERLRRR